MLRIFEWKQVGHSSPNVREISNWKCKITILPLGGKLPKYPWWFLLFHCVASLADTWRAWFKRWSTGLAGYSFLASRLPGTRMFSFCVLISRKNAKSFCFLLRFALFTCSVPEILLSFDFGSVSADFPHRSVKSESASSLFGFCP